MSKLRFYAASNIDDPEIYSLFECGDPKPLMPSQPDEAPIHVLSKVILSRWLGILFPAVAFLQKIQLACLLLVRGLLEFVSLHQKQDIFHQPGWHLVDKLLHNYDIPGRYLGG